MLALPSSESRVPTPPRTLLPVPRSYGLIRQSHVALLSFSFWPRLRSLCRLLPASAATRIFPTLFLRICPVMPEPIPRRVPLSAFAWFFLSVFGLPHKEDWIGFPLRFREHDFPRAWFRGCSYFVMFKPHSLLASQIAPTAASCPRRAAEAFTSEQNVRRYLRTHRTCYPPDYRQLAGRGLSPR